MSKNNKKKKKVTGRKIFAYIMLFVALSFPITAILSYILR